MQRLTASTFLAVSSAENAFSMSAEMLLAASAEAADWKIMTPLKMIIAVPADRCTVSSAKQYTQTLVYASDRVKKRSVLCG